jgi:uncharacterized protein with ATP-grasp and redox domains
MKIHPRCMSCLIAQVENAFRLLKPTATDEEIIRIQRDVMKKLIDVPQDRAPYFGQTLYRLIAQELDQLDPYHAIKTHYNQLALTMVPQIEAIVKNAKDPLLTLMAIAIVGNTIDFGTDHKIDLTKEIREFSLAKLAVNEYPTLKKDLARAQNILILGDNAGEIVFDKIMIQSLKTYYPKKYVTYAVRGGPAINDSTIEDAQTVGMLEICPVVEGAAAPGIILEESSKAFLNAFHSADLIISKGQGNYESMDEIPTPQSQLYFLLKAKCQLIADTFHVPFGSLILARKK